MIWQLNSATQWRKLDWLPADLVNPLPVGLNESLKKFLLSSLLCNILKLHVDGFHSSKTCAQFSSTASVGWIVICFASRRPRRAQRGPVKNSGKNKEVFFPLFAVHRFYSKNIRISLNILNSCSMDFYLLASKEQQVEILYYQGVCDQQPSILIRQCQPTTEYQQNPGWNICTTELEVSPFLSSIQILLFLLQVKLWVKCKHKFSVGVFLGSFVTF